MAFSWMYCLQFSDTCCREIKPWGNICVENATHFLFTWKGFSIICSHISQMCLEKRNWMTELFFSHFQELIICSPYFYSKHVICETQLIPNIIFFLLRPTFFLMLLLLIPTLRVCNACILHSSSCNIHLLTDNLHNSCIPQQWWVLFMVAYE